VCRSAEAIAFVIHTARFPESIRFYCEYLELELVEEWHEGGRGAVIRLAEDADLELIALDVEPGSHGGVALGLEVDAVDAWYERLVARGVTVGRPPIDAFGKHGSA
jgi:catechol 2,3-dioxygenase-like lactoylglutathione lyase family enzyme